MRSLYFIWYITLLTPILGSVQITTLYSSSFQINENYNPLPFLITDVNPNFEGSGTKYTIAMWVNHDTWTTENKWRLAMRISQATTSSAEFGEGRVFMHATNLNAAPTVSPMIAASTGDQDGVTPISSWNANSHFPASKWVFFAYSVDTETGSQAFLHMYLNTPTTILGNYFGTFIKTGLYTIRPDATVYMGKDDSGNSTYVPCFCKAIAILYSNTFINNQNDLSKLAGPESDYIEDLTYYSTPSTSTSQTFVINRKDRTGVVSPQTGQKGTTSGTGDPQQIPPPGGFNMFKCQGDQILRYANGDMTTGVYIEFMIRPSSTVSSLTHTIFSYFDSSTGVTFFRVYYSKASMNIVVELRLSSGTMSPVSSPTSSLTGGAWSSVKVSVKRTYLVGLSPYIVEVKVDSTSPGTMTFYSPGSSLTPVLDSRFDLTSVNIATWCAEFSGSTSTVINYATADVAMFRLVKTPGTTYVDTSSSIDSCTTALGSSNTLMFCQTCATSYFRHEDTTCTDECPDQYTSIDLDICGSLSPVQDIVPCTTTTQCSNPFLTCNNANLTCSPCQSDADCSDHIGYTTCLNGFCRGYRQITWSFDVDTLTFTLVPDAEFVINSPPIDNYITLTINGKDFYPQTLNYTGNYEKIYIVLPKNTMPVGKCVAVVTIQDLTDETTEAVILQTSSEITGTYTKPSAIGYSLVLVKRPTVFHMIFYNYTFDTIKNLKKNLKFSFDGYANSPLTPNDTNLTLINSYTLQIELNFTVNESIYALGLTVDTTQWNSANLTVDPALSPTFQTAYVEVLPDGHTAFYFSRVVKISAIGTAAFCFLIDLLTSCSRSTYVRFYAMTQRIAILQFINIQYHSITTGFFQEMNLDFSTMPSFFISITNTTSLQPEKNVTILNMPNHIGYPNVFLQGYGGTALLQGIAFFIGTLLSIIHCIVAKKKVSWLPHLERVKKIFVFNLIFLIFFSTTPKLVLGMSIFFQNANLFSAYASGSFAVGCVYVLAFVTVYMILYRNAKNEKDKASKRFFGKIEILRYDYKDTKAGRAAPMVFTTVNFLTALFTGVVGASGKAQAAMLTVFPFFGVVYWGITKGLKETGELAIMIFSESCFILAGIFHAVLSIYDLDDPTRLNIGWGMMGVYAVLIWGNMLFRAYGLVKGIKDFISKKKEKSEDEEEGEEDPKKAKGSSRDKRGKGSPRGGYGPYDGFGGYDGPGGYGGYGGYGGPNGTLAVDIPEYTDYYGVNYNNDLSHNNMNSSAEVALNDSRDMEPQNQKSRLIKIDKSALQKDDFMGKAPPINSKKQSLMPQDPMMYPPHGPNFLPPQGPNFLPPQGTNFLSPQNLDYPAQNPDYMPQGPKYNNRKQRPTMKPQHDQNYLQPPNHMMGEAEWNPNQPEWNPNQPEWNQNQQGMDYNNNPEFDPNQEPKPRMRSHSRTKSERNRNRFPSQGPTDQMLNQEEPVQMQKEPKERRPTQMEPSYQPKRKTIKIDAENIGEQPQQQLQPQQQPQPRRKTNTFVIG